MNAERIPHRNSLSGSHFGGCNVGVSYISSEEAAADDLGDLTNRLAITRVRSWYSRGELLPMA